MTSLAATLALGDRARIRVGQIQGQGAVWFGGTQSEVAQGAEVGPRYQRAEDLDCQRHDDPDLRAERRAACDRLHDHQDADRPGRLYLRLAGLIHLAALLRAAATMYVRDGGDGG